MKKYLFGIFLGILFATTSVAFAQAVDMISPSVPLPQKPIKLTVTKTYKAPTFSIKIPKQWKAVDMGNTVLFNYANYDMGALGGPGNVSWGISDEDFSAWVEAEKQQIMDRFVDDDVSFVLQEDHAYKMKGAEAHFFEGAISEGGKTAAHVQELLVKRGSKLYILQLFSYDWHWKAHKPIYKKIFKSFQPT